MEFVHLHCHSNYSLLLGASPIEEIVARARRLGMSAIALTDTNNVYGAFEFCRLAERYGVRPVVGAQVRFREGDLVLLVRDEQGWGNLCEVLTRYHLDGVRGACEALSDYHRGLIALAKGLQLARLLQRIFPAGDIYLEIQAPRPALRVSIPKVATGPVFFAEPDDYQTHRVLTAIRLNRPLKSLPASAFVSPTSWLKSKEEMCRAFAAEPEAIANTAKIARRCQFRLRPRAPQLPEFGLPEGVGSAQEFLSGLCWAELRRRYPGFDERRIRQLREELAIIEELGMAAYFLIVWDIARWARSRGIPVWGRGSAANSLVSHLLGLTQPDPIRYNLYFPRFLSRGRKGCPDVDLDFCWRRREEVLGYVLQRYGSQHAAMLSTHVTFGARFALREVGRVLGLGQSELRQLTRGIPHFASAPLREIIEKTPECGRHPLKSDAFAKVVALAERIRGFPRHLSVHAGGMVISREKLYRQVPLERSSQNLVITQFEMRSAEGMGLVKIDLLGQRALSVIADTVDAVRSNYGIEVDLSKIDRKDPRTLELLACGRTIGCFQLESPSMRNLLQRLNPRSEDDVITAVALVRPGPREGGMLDKFIRRFHHKEPISYLHPALKPILEESLGIIMTEEQVMRIAVEVVGLTDAEAHQMRKMITKGCDYAQARRIEARFKQSALKKGFSARLTDQLWELVARFASFSFCKAHAVSYGLLSYRCAYLKAHFPAEYLAAMISNYGGYYGTKEYVQEAKRCGLKVLLPCVNRSAAQYTGKQGAVRIGLAQVTGLRRKTLAAILASRKSAGEYRDLAEFILRVNPSYQETETLIRCGATDCFGLTRPQLLWQAMRLHPAVVGEHKGTADLGLGLLSAPPAPPPLAEYPLQDRQKMEIEILGVDPYLRTDNLSARYGLVKSSELARYKNRYVKVSGRIITAKRIRTRQGSYMKFITLEDSGGLIEVVLFPKVYQKYGAKTVGSERVLVKGLLKEEDGALMLNAQSLETLN